MSNQPNHEFQREAIGVATFYWYRHKMLLRPVSGVLDIIDEVASPFIKVP